MVYEVVMGSGLLESTVCVGFLHHLFMVEEEYTLFFFISLTMYLSYTVILNSDYVSELGYAST